MVSVQLEMERNCLAGECQDWKWRWIETDFYCNYNKEHPPPWRGGRWGGGDKHSHHFHDLGRMCKSLPAARDTVSVFLLLAQTVRRVGEPE